MNRICAENAKPENTKTIINLTFGGEDPKVDLGTEG